jgi:transcriptional regulator with XRE-family HTH domain
MYFPINLKLLRKRYHFSQERLAKKLNRTNTTISNWEKGSNNPDFDSLIILRDIFNISIDTMLFRNIGEMSRDDEDSEILEKSKLAHKEGIIETLQRRMDDLEAEIKSIKEKR